MPQSGSSGESIEKLINRRNFIRTGLAAGIAGVAGCGSQSETTEPGNKDTPTNENTDGQSTETTSGGNPIRDTFYSVSGRANPVDAQYNPYNSTNTVFSPNNSPVVMMYDWLFKYNPDTGKYERRLVDELNAEGKTVTLKLRDDITWTNGDKFTSEDVYTQYQLEKYQGLPTWDNLEEVSVTGDYELELKLKKEANLQILFEQINLRCSINRNEYGQWLEKLEGATTDDEIEGILGDFLQWSYPQDYPNKMPVSYGPFKVSDVSESTWKLESHDGYPVKNNFDSVEYTFMTSSEAKWGKMIAGDFDGVAMLPASEAVQQQFPDYMDKITIPDIVGVALHFQKDHQVFGKRKFRQAMAYLIDQERVAKQTLPRFAPRDTLTGLSINQNEQWLDTNKFIDYGQKSKPDKAAAAMQDGGFQRDGDKWLDQNGNPISFEIMTPPWTGPQNQAKVWESMLGQFGINVNVRVVDGGTAASNWNSGKYEVFSWFQGGGPHPYLAYNTMLEPPFQNNNTPMEVELPPVGSPGGSKESFNVKEALSSMPTTRDKETMSTLVEKVAWYFNYTVPVITPTSGTLTSYLNSKDWEYPPVDDDRMRIEYPMFDLLRQTKEGTNEARLQSKVE